MNLKPLGDRVIVKADEVETTTAGGLFIASETKEKPQTGEIVEVVITFVPCSLGKSLALEPTLPVSRKLALHPLL